MARDSDVFNIHEAAAFLGAHEQTVRRLARRRAIPCFKVGKDWRFRKEALLRWSEEQGSPSHQPSVLIVDDDAAVCRAFALGAERAGCRVHCATDGSAGLAMVAQETPDLILLDLVMPKMNGPEFLAELRKTHPDLPVVVVTGYPDGDLVHQATKYAPLMVLPKSSASDQIERMVGALVAAKSSVLRRG